VKVWFSAEQARYIRERKWSGTQKIREQKDGSIILSIETSGWGMGRGGFFLMDRRPGSWSPKHCGRRSGRRLRRC